MAASSLISTSPLDQLTGKCHKLIAILTAIVKKPREGTKDGTWKCFSFFQSSPFALYSITPIKRRAW